MKDRLITKELAKLYEKQGYLEDSLTCYISLYEETKEQEFADAIEKIQNKISPQEKKENKTDLKGKGNKALLLFEEWLNMLILEKKIQSFKKVQKKFE